MHILGAGLSGLSAFLYWLKLVLKFMYTKSEQIAVRDLMEIFQGLENWTSGNDFFEDMRDWGLDPESFKSDAFSVVDLIHPDDVITQPRTEGLAFRVVERGTDEHCIDQGFKRMAISAGAKIHYNSKRDPKDCQIILAGPKESSAVAFGEVFHTDHRIMSLSS